MKHQEQWNTFFAAEKNISYDEHMLKTIELAHSVRRPCKNMHRISFTAVIVKQFRFFALKIWFLQGMVLALLSFLFFRLYYTVPPYGAGSFEWTQRNISRFLCLCSSIIVLSAIPLLLRSTRFQMMELEQSTYFSLRGNLMAQLLFIGIGDFGMLAVLALLTRKFQITGNIIFLSLVIPYLTAAASCLMLWIRTKPSFFHNASMVLCIISAYLTHEAIEESILLLADTSFYLWVLYAFVCIGILYCECRKVWLQGTIEKMIL